MFYISVEIYDEAAKVRASIKEVYVTYGRQDPRHLDTTLELKRRKMERVMDCY